MEGGEVYVIGEGEANIYHACALVLPHTHSISRAKRKCWKHDLNFPLLRLASEKKKDRSERPAREGKMIQGEKMEAPLALE